jgi:hypothetical protein
MPVERRSAVQRAVEAAKSAAAALKAEHEAGLRGDDSPAAPIWPTPSAQLAAIKRLFRGSPTPSAGPEDTADLDAEAGEVAEAMRGIDWDGVRAAAAERGSDVAKTMKEMATHVDWAKVQPVAAQVSSALIAAVASGRLPVGGRLGPIVAKAITDQQQQLVNRVATNLEHSQSLVPVEFRQIIETTAREQPPTGRPPA